MVSSRRDFLKVSTATAAAIGMGGLAGCSDILNGNKNNNNGSPPAYVNWMYDPTEIMSVENRVFATLNVAQIYEQTGQYPDEVKQQLDQMETQFEEVGVENLASVTGVGFADDDVERGGMTMAAGGSFDSEEIVDKLETQIEQTTQEEDRLEQSSYKNYDLYHATEEYPSGGQDSNISVTLGVGSDALLVGTVVDDEIESDSAVEQMVDVNDGDVDTYYAADEDIAKIVDMLGDPTVAFGGDIGSDIGSDEFLSEVPSTEEGENLVDVLSDLATLGFGATLTEDTAETTIVMVYESVEDASTEDVQAILDQIKEEDTEAWEQLGDVSVNQDGRGISVTTSTDVEELWNSMENDQNELTENAPTVDFDYERQADGSYDIIHAGGDDFTAENVHVQYTRADGRVEAIWWDEGSDLDRGETVSAGSTLSIPDAVESGSTLRVNWASSDGGSSSTIGQYTVP